MDYGPEDDYPHAPGTQEDWQESVWVQWYDAAAGIGGLHRIGTEPNRGRANCWFGLITDEGSRFRRVLESVPLRSKDREDCFAAGDDLRMTFEDGRPKLRLAQSECEVSLDFFDDHPRFNLWDYREHKGQELMEELAPKHYEVGGRVVGKVRLGEKAYSVNGLGYRDHSWGPRDYTAWNVHRWVAGTFGPALSFSLVNIHGTQGGLVRTGYVVRDGKPVVAEHIDIVTYLEPDGLTHRGGHAVATLTDGDEIRLDCELVDGVMFNLHEFAGIDTICRVTSGELTGGFGDFEMSNNARNGRDMPTSAIGAALVDGLSTRENR